MFELLPSDQENYPLVQEFMDSFQQELGYFVEYAAYENHSIQDCSRTTIKKEKDKLSIKLQTVMITVKKMLKALQSGDKGKPGTELLHHLVRLVQHSNVLLCLTGPLL